MDVDTLLATKVRVGVTGFSRSGKTVFICALAQALLTADAWIAKRGQGPLAEFGPFARREFSRSRVNRQANSNGLPEFQLDAIRDVMAGSDAHWPSRTEGITRLTIDLASDPRGWPGSIAKDALGSLGYGVIQLELVDYPGEWLIDLPMLSQDFSQWSEGVLRLAKTDVRQAMSEPYFAWMSRTATSGTSGIQTIDEAASLWADYLKTAAGAGLSFNQPGMAVCPDSTRDPALFRLAPLPTRDFPEVLVAEMQKRFERYKKEVVKPFYKDHFSRIDCQIVLVDLLRVLEAGKGHYDDLVAAQRALIPSFNYSKGGPLDWIGGVRTTRVLFAATKADHVVKSDRQNLSDLLEKMLRYVDVDKVLGWSTKAIDTIALCSVRATEDYRKKILPQREILLGKPANEAEDGPWDPGGLLDQGEWTGSPIHRRPALAVVRILRTGTRMNPSRAGSPPLDFLIGDKFK